MRVFFFEETAEGMGDFDLELSGLCLLEVAALVCFLARLGFLFSFSSSFNSLKSLSFLALERSW